MIARIHETCGLAGLLNCHGTAQNLTAKAQISTLPLALPNHSFTIWLNTLRGRLHGRRRYSAGPTPYSLVPHAAFGAEPFAIICDRYEKCPLKPKR